MPRARPLRKRGQGTDLRRPRPLPSNEATPKSESAAKRPPERPAQTAQEEEENVAARPTAIPRKAASAAQASDWRNNARGDSLKIGSRPGNTSMPTVYPDGGSGGPDQLIHQSTWKVQLAIMVTR